MSAKYVIPIGIFRVQDCSMEPGFSPGDYVVVSRWHAGLGNGDVVVLPNPITGRILIKRVSRVGNGWIFVRGDNSAHSEDSRKFGRVKTSTVIGKVMAKI